MAVLKHSTGGYRAYKKIFGVEYQFYSPNKKEAEKEQEKFEVLAIKAIRNKPKKLFWGNGRMIGFSIAARFRKKRKPIIVVRMQLKRDGKTFRKEITHQTIELTWAWIRREWKDFYEVSVEERIKLHDEINLSKSLYTADIHTAKIKIKKNLNNDIA